MSYDYCEFPEFFSAQWPVAKKKHKCCECDQPIHPGEKYGRFTGKWDGDLGSFKQHLDCEKACVFIRDKFQQGECIPFGTLFEFYDEDDQLSKKYEDSLEFRKIMARILWRKRKERNRDDQKPKARRAFKTDPGIQS